MILICLVTGDLCTARDCTEGCAWLAAGQVPVLPQSPCELCGELCDWDGEPVLCPTCAREGPQDGGV
jgi:hypothetical protein